ncbi:MAG: 4Fe-4S binding protein [Bacillota bacterium]|nr:4Fe-4S binding protein [Bacillota bacterium]
MIDVEKLIDYVSTRMKTIAIKHSRCCKVISPLSKCNLCYDICPSKAINHDDDKIVILESCYECGMCAAVCPTEALSIQKPTEFDLLEEIEKAGHSDSKIVLTCRENNKGVLQDAIVIPCLGSLSVEFLFFLNTLEFPIYILSSEVNCQSCRIAKGRTIYFEQLKKAAIWQQNINNTVNSINNVTEISSIINSKEQSNDKLDIGRRQLFANVFSSVKKIPRLTIDSFSASQKKAYNNDENNLVFHSFRLQILKKRLSIININEDCVLDNLFQPFHDKKCFLCKACVILCPVNALIYEQSNGTILLKTDKCTGCGLCVDICYNKSLKLKTKTVKSLLSKQVTELIVDKPEA